MNKDEDRNDIAVIGMSGAFPGAANIDALWRNLVAGKSGIVDLTDEDCIAAGVPENLYKDADYVKRSAFMEGAKQFDAAFFGYSDAEAELMDPQHRVFLQHSWAAMESACYIPDEVSGVVGVYAACGFNRYLINKLGIDTKRFDIEDFQKMLASDKDFLATRVSYKLNLKGPSFTVQCGCSSSLVAVQMGCTALQTYQCDLALCGGVTLNVPHKAGYRYTDGLIFSPDGQCRAFTDEANGTVFGEGVGVVALKRLDEAMEDGDNILAVIRGAAVNNDGRIKVGYTAPSAQGQSEVIMLAQALADVEPETVDFIETHGTGTKMGDPIEMVGLKDVFAKVSSHRCALGAIKADIGHLDAAAGIAGFIKTALVVRHKVIPPMRYAGNISPRLLSDDSPFFFNPEQVDLSTRPGDVVAGVSSFGVGGTNVHVVLASPPQRTESKQQPILRHCPVTANSTGAVKRYQDSIASFAKDHPYEWDALAFTMSKGRKLYNYRSYLTLSNSDHECVIKYGDIHHVRNSAELAFLFSGQGMQFPGMARSLYDSDQTYRELLDECLRIAGEYCDTDLHALLLTDSPKQEYEQALKKTENSQPALFITEYALAKTLMVKGITPALMIGHSLGEYVAACIAGVMGIEDAIRLVCLRGRMMGSCEDSGMITVFAGSDDISQYLCDSLEIALFNSPKNTVIAGSRADVAKLQTTLKTAGIESRDLPVSHAFHSKFMEPILDKFRQAVESVSLSKPTIPIISMYGDYAGPGAKLWDVEYWVQHVRQPVNFIGGAKALLDSGVGIHVEIGPGRGLLSLVSSQPDFSADLQSVTSIERNRGEYTQKTMDELLLELWCTGADINLDTLVPESYFIDAPTYPFEPREYWLPDLLIEPGKTLTITEQSEQLEAVSDRIANCWYQVFGRNDILASDNFIELGGDSLMGVRLAHLLSESLGIEVNISTIMRYPSIAAMVEKYDVEDTSDQHFSTMFSIDKRGMGKPIFMISGAHEDRYVVKGKSNYEEDAYRYFSTLVQNLGGHHPVFGFRPRGIFYEEEFHTSVEAMATECVSQIKSVQPQGPYILSGECVGGIVAYEMAHQLLEAGDEIESLILLDTNFPTPTFRFLETSRVKLRRTKRSVVRILRNLQKGDWKSFVHETLDSLNSLGLFLFPINQKRRHLRNALFGSQIYLDLLLRYRPKPLPIKVHLLVNQDWWSKNRTLGWEKMHGVNIDIQAVPGDHRTRLTTHGHELGSLINGLIE